jgi:hypothetical protein
MFAINYCPDLRIGLAMSYFAEDHITPGLIHPDE